jgi:hypothetical protein
MKVEMTGISPDQLHLSELATGLPQKRKNWLSMSERLWLAVVILKQVH